MIDHETHRALVEAGYAPLDEYIVVASGGCAPPVIVPRSTYCAACGQNVCPHPDLVFQGVVPGSATRPALPLVRTQGEPGARADLSGSAPVGRNVSPASHRLGVSHGQ